jgi:hypothetical protein
MTWLEIAVGVEVDNLVDAGGHFAQTIGDFRMNKGVSKIKVCTLLISTFL